MIKEYRMPYYTLAGLADYVANRTPKGSFLTAVLSNDLKSAVWHADIKNTESLVDIVKFIYNNIPANSWGSDAAVQNWIKQGGSKSGITGISMEQLFQRWLEKVEVY
jgi:hypothetical protein